MDNDISVDDAILRLGSAGLPAGDAEQLIRWARQTSERADRYEVSFKKLRLDFATIIEVAKQINAKSLNLELIEKFTLNMVMGQFAVLSGVVCRRDSVQTDRIVPVAAKHLALPEGFAFDVNGPFGRKLVAMGRPAFIREEDRAMDVFAEVETLRKARVHVVVPLVRSGADNEVDLEGVIGLGEKVGRGGYTDSELAFLGLLGNLIAISLSNAHLYRRSVTDGLTRCFSRGYFDVALVQEVERARRYGEKGRPRALTLFMVDIDRFKSINDTHGHQVGDDALRNLAVVLDKALRKTDTIARYGGEEFAVILPQTEKPPATMVAERLRGRVEAGRIPLRDGGEIAITVSVGLATFPEDASEPADLIRAADLALYRAKDGGRNQVVVCGTGAPPPVS